MKKILIVNNEREIDDLGWIPYLQRALRKVDANAEIMVIHHSQLHQTYFSALAPTHTILYGRVTHHWSIEEIMADYTAELEFIRTTNRPTLGICAGHQLMAIACGSTIRQMVPCEDMDIVESGFLPIHSENNSKLFNGLPETFLCNCFHRDEVAELPQGFHSIGSGDVCAIHAMERDDAPVFGVQFHPEWSLGSFQAGHAILSNFLAI